MRHAIGTLLVLVVLVCTFPQACSAYSVLTHEQIVDLLWDEQIKPLLLQKYPGATADDLRVAHSYAYGGCLIQDMGYYPFGNRLFSDLVHYVRSGDFVQALLSEATDVNEYRSSVVPAVPAGELINAVVANELQDREQLRKWIYVIEKREGNQSLTEEQVETKNGPLYRVLARDGVPLTPDQRRQDNARIGRLLHDTGQQAKLKQQYDDDEQKLEKLMRVMPQAFLYDYDGVDGKFVRLKFRPDPSYQPPDYEARVVHSLAGTVLIDSQHQRLAKLSGQLINGVNFGFGILGHIDNGGTIEIGRVQVGPLQWKTALLNIQLSGRLIFFKTISKQQYEVRSNFRAVPGDLSLADANDLLVSPILHSPGPKPRHGDPATTAFNLPQESLPE
ncbi:MAG: zinc dependent phospholipase C family protein [Acidobacteriia bacterium]|nr:zinc dependent phospholipase C family protein [Terriglobia bacterium]